MGQDGVLGVDAAASPIVAPSTLSTVTTGEPDSDGAALAEPRDDSLEMTRSVSDPPLSNGGGGNTSVCNVASMLHNLSASHSRWGGGT